MNILEIKITDDFLEILDEVPCLLDVLGMDGVYLAGGALRTLISMDEEFSPEKTDIDLFFRDGGVLLDVKNYLEKYGYYKIFQCPEGKLASYVYLNGEEPKWKVQCISVDFYPSIENVIKSFDFSVTMFGTDGEVLVMGETSIQDTLDKNLVWNIITYPASSMRRLMKYARKGYSMREIEFQRFVERVGNHDGDILDFNLVYVD